MLVFFGLRMTKLGIFIGSGNLSVSVSVYSPTLFPRMYELPVSIIRFPFFSGACSRFLLYLFLPCFSHRKKKDAAAIGAKPAVIVRSMVNPLNW